MNDVDGGPVDRIQWLDYARGVGIILVVLAHTIGGLRAEIVGPKLHNYELIDLLIYSFHMPLFFFVSGVLFAKRLSSTWQYYFRAAAIGIVVPYFLWTIAFVSLQSLVPTEVNNLYNFEALAHIWRQPVGHMWFLYALLIVQIVLLVFVRAFGVPGVIVAGCIFAFLYSLPALHPWLGPVATAIAMGGTFLAMGMTATAWRLIPASRSQAWITFALMAVLWLGSELTLLYLSGPHALAPLVAVFGVCMTMAVCILLPPVQGFIIDNACSTRSGLNRDLCGTPDLHSGSAYLALSGGYLRRPFACVVGVATLDCSHLQFFSFWQIGSTLRPMSDLGATGNSCTVGARLAFVAKWSRVAATHVQ